MYQLYKFISILLYPLVKLILKSRIKKNKEDPHRAREKLGYSKRQRPKGSLIWFHAASIGEFNAILPIIKSISEEFPSIHILVTTVTLTAANIAANNLPHNAIHQFSPFDCDNIIEKFIKHWQPNLIIWTESEFWPNMIIRSSKQAPLLLINARLSEKSFSKWNLIKPLARFILNKFSLILTQNKESKIFIDKLGVKNAIESGNLKFIAGHFNFESKDLDKLKKEVKNRIAVMAASTHPGEEEIFTEIHSSLKEKHPNLLTIIAPRHPNRTEEVITILKKSNLKFVTRSSQDKITKATDIVLVDTLGEFGLFYRLTKIVCVGGSWARIGHNFIEAAKLGNLIIFGPCMNNSREVSDYFLNKNAALTANNTHEIEKIIENYLSHPADFSQLQKNAIITVNEMDKIKESVIHDIRPYISILVERP